MMVNRKILILLAATLSMISAARAEAQSNAPKPLVDHVNRSYSDTKAKLSKPLPGSIPVASPFYNTKSTLTKAQIDALSGKLPEAERKSLDETVKHAEGAVGQRLTDESNTRMRAGEALYNAGRPR